jgi:O-antigen/teichoic acid export membrane protein
LVNAGPIAVDILADSDQADAVTKFGNGVLLSRIPLFLFQAVQAALLPRLARLAAVNNMVEFRSGFKKLMYVVLGVAVIGIIGSYAVGPKILEVMYDGGLDRRTLTLLAVGSGIYMIALATAQAVIALHGHAWVALGWVLSMLTFVVVTAYSSDDLYMRVELGLVSASCVALAIFWFALRARLRSGATVDEESIIEAFGEQPLEG